MERFVSWFLLIGFLIWKIFFFYWEFCDEERVWLAFNKLDGEAKEQQEDIQIDRKYRDMHPICFWQRMKKVLVDIWFPHDYYDILDYRSVDY